MVRRKMGIRLVKRLFSSAASLTGMIYLTMTSHDTTIVDARSNGVVAVIYEDSRFLVIRRGPAVIAPGKLCFPGGSPRPGEPAKHAVEREVREELGIDCPARGMIWESVTSWNVALSWWRMDWNPAAEIMPHPDEVAWAGWLSLEELTAADDLLESNRQFLDALQQGQLAINVV